MSNRRTGPISGPRDPRKETDIPTNDTDARIIAHLKRLADQDEPLPTVGEISDDLLITTSKVRASMNRLAGVGRVRTVGETYSGAKTWALTSDSRFPAKS
jgi:chromosome condensin MukBEF MukE localization factor